MLVSWRQESKKDYGSDYKHDINIDNIKTGAVLRIADAVEVMSRRYTDLLDQVESAKRDAEFYRKLYLKMQRRNYALRGVITRMKRAKERKGP